MFILQGCRNSKKKVQLYFESVRSYLVGVNFQFLNFNLHFL